MIVYNTKEWFGILHLHKSDTLRQLFPLMVFLCIYTAVIAFCVLHWFKVSEESYLSNIPLMHSLLGFAISIILVFRTNTAYDRWWEGRKLWGSLVNVSRNMAIKFNIFLPERDDASREMLATVIPKFSEALMHHLRSEALKFSLDDRPHPEIPEIDNTRHVPAQIASLIINKANRMYKDNIISGEQLITINDDITALMDICGACERIRNTPIPYSYISFIKKFISVYVVSLPFGFVFSLGFLTVPIVAFVFYVLASLEIIAEEIEEPFGKDTNDLPMEKMCKTIDVSVKEIFTYV